jgi:hypothetical protein
MALGILDNTRSNKLLEIAARKPGFSCQGQIGRFLDEYLVAEVLLRQLIEYYATDLSRHASKILLTQQINAALAHFGFVVAQSTVTDAFQGGDGLKGFKSGRQLRNGFLHNLSPEDNAEIQSKAEDLNRLVRSIITPIVCLCTKSIQGQSTTNTQGNYAL